MATDRHFNVRAAVPPHGAKAELPPTGATFDAFLTWHPSVRRFRVARRCQAQKSPRTVADTYKDRQCKKSTTYWYAGPPPQWVVDYDGATHWDQPMCREHLISQVLSDDWLQWRRGRDAARKP